MGWAKLLMGSAWCQEDMAKCLYSEKLPTWHLGLYSCMHGGLCWPLLHSDGQTDLELKSCVEPVCEENHFHHQGGWNWVSPPRGRWSLGAWTCRRVTIFGKFVKACEEIGMRRSYEDHQKHFYNVHVSFGRFPAQQVTFILGVPAADF